MRIKELRESGLSFVNSVVQLLERLLDYRYPSLTTTLYLNFEQFNETFVGTVILERFAVFRNVVSSREEYRDMKMGCIVNLLVNICTIIFLKCLIIHSNQNKQKFFISQP